MHRTTAWCDCWCTADAYTVCCSALLVQIDAAECEVSALISVALTAGGMFTVEAKLGDDVVPSRVTESLQAPRTATACLLLQQAGQWTVTVLLDTSSPKDSDERIEIARQLVEVEEGAASASCCRLRGFWPMQGAIAEVPAGFIIQASNR